MAGFCQGSMKAVFLLCLAVAGFLIPGCREREWEPGLALTVNGRPVPVSAVDQVLEWGFYPGLGRGGEIEGANSLPLIIDKLVDEQLILAEAEKSGLSVSQFEVDDAATTLATAWFGVKPPPAELGDLRRALRNQLLIQKMTVKVMTERRILSAAQWQVFWDRWPRAQSPRYRVRVLMLPRSEAPPELPAEKISLVELADSFEKTGLPVVLSEPFWLPGDSLEAAEREVLDQALAQGRFSPAVRLKESWAVYEVLGLDPGPSLEEEFKKARTAYEEQAGEAAFSNWLADMRSKAQVELNPALAEMLKAAETAG